MNSYITLYFMTCLSIILLWADLKFKYSFHEVSKMLKKINVQYTINEYTTKAIAISIVIFIIVYSTIEDLSYTLFLIGYILLFLPYLNYIHCVRIYKEKLNKEIFDYVNIALTYLNENKTVTKTLIDCSTVLDSPLKDELIKTITKINQGNSLENSLQSIYQCEEIKKLHQLYISKSKDGITSLVQYKVLSKYIEEKEKLANNFKIGMDTKRKGFYMVICFSLFSAYLTKTMFQSDLVSNASQLNFIYFIFYLFHLNLALFFERNFAKKRGLK